VGRRSAVPGLSAIRVPACTWHMPSALPCCAVLVLGSNGWRRLPSRVLLLPPRREEAERLALHPCCLCVRTANACRTGRAFVTLPPLVSPPARKREDAGASPGSLSYPQASSRTVKAAVVRGGNEIAAMVGERVDLARKPPRLRSSSSTCETWPERSRRARPEFSNLNRES
jgi:hypothetical protein